jgi:hypothetical protein
MYAEATFGNHEDVTALTFPEFKASGSQNLKFKYHMYGIDTGTLLVKAKLKGDNSVLSLWNIFESQFNRNKFLLIIKPLEPSEEVGCV